MRFNPRRLVNSLVTFSIWCFIGAMITTYRQSPRHLTSLNCSRTKFTNSYTSPNSPNYDDVMIGVMTSRKYLTSRATAVFKTWGRDVTGKVVFYVGKGENSSFLTDGELEGQESIKIINDLPVVELINIDDVMYPPRHKSFAMLRHMFNNYGRHFRWFMRADDDSYIRYHDLSLFLKSINDNSPRYLGSGGYGKRQERGHLGVYKGGAYCMGGPGVVLSASALKLLVDHLAHCDVTAVTPHEDTELGRCVQQFLNVSCPIRSGLLQNLFRHSYNRRDFTGNLKDIWFSALTLHPVKQPKIMFKLHLDFQHRQLQVLKLFKQKLVSEITTMSNIIRKKEEIQTMESKKAPIPVSPLRLKNKNTKNEKSHRVNLGDGSLTSDSFNLETNQTRERDDIPIWAYLGVGRQSFQLSNFHSHMKIIQKVVDNLKKLNRGQITDKQVMMKYQTNVPCHGLLHKLTVHNQERFQSFMLVDSLEELEWRELDTQFASYSSSANNTQTLSTNSQTAHPSNSSNSTPFLKQSNSLTPLTHMKLSSWPTLQILVALYGRQQTFSRFTDYLSSAVMKYSGKVQLYVALYSNSSNEQKQISNISKSHPALKMTIVKMPGTFSRSAALNALARRFEHDAILVLMDVDLILKEQFLYRVALNVEPHTAYFPIVFSTYSPDAVCYGRSDCSPQLFNFSRDVGMWRDFAFGTVAVQARDFIQTSGLNDKIKGWGKEDVDFFHRCVAKGMTIIRAADTGLVHVYHEKLCDPRLPADQLRMCHGSQTALYASDAVLSQMILDFQNKTK